MDFRCNKSKNVQSPIGEDPTLQLQQDREDLQSILGTKNIEFIQNPSAGVISANLTRELGCDIFWFGGHGDSTEEEGIIYLDNQTSLEISVLKQGFRTAVDRGLQIAVFNCCRGLGLADQLIDTNIPYIVVMRVEIPNLLAKQFLKDLLIQYRQGVDFAQAFKFARQQLSLAAPTKFADWLPVLFHNPLSRSVTWQNLEQSRARLPLPSSVIKLCRSITQSQWQVWTGLGLGIVLSSLGYILKSQNPLLRLENNLIDRLQQVQATKIIDQKSNVVMVNYDARTVGGVVRPGLLSATIDFVTAQASPIAWGIGLAIQPDNDSLNLDFPNIVNCYPGINSNQSFNYSLRQENCDNSSLASELFTQYREHQKLSPPEILWSDEFRLNPALSRRIESIDITKIRGLSPVQIKKIFNGKLVVISQNTHNRQSQFPTPPPISADALALDQLLIASSNYGAVPILQSRSLAEDFLWILMWCTATTVVVWRGNIRSFLPTTISIIGSCLVISGILLFNGYSVPVIVTILAIGGAGVSVFGINQIAGRIYPDLARIYYQRGLSKARSGQSQGSIEDLRSAARLLGEQGKKAQARRVQNKIEALEKDS